MAKPLTQPLPCYNLTIYTPGMAAGLFVGKGWYFIASESKDKDKHKLYELRKRYITCPEDLARLAEKYPLMQATMMRPHRDVSKFYKGCYYMHFGSNDEYEVLRCVKAGIRFVTFVDKNEKQHKLPVRRYLNFQHCPAIKDGWQDIFSYEAIDPLYALEMYTLSEC